MEGNCLSCIKFLMFTFNFLFFVCGSVLLSAGLWVLLDPLGFRAMVTSDPLLFTGVYLLLALGSGLFLLGFMGCCGAAKENRCLLLLFFMLILFIFLSELAAAILVFLFRDHLTREYLTRELRRHYRGQNHSDVFSSTWNTVMSSFGCCGVSGPQDFQDSLLRRLGPRQLPEACCGGGGEIGGPGEGRGPREGGGPVLEPCVSGATRDYAHIKGCYSSLLDYFETYIFSAGALAVIVLTIQLFALIFSMCLFRGIH